MAYHKNYSYKNERKPVSTTDFIFGLRPIEEAIKSGREIDKLLIQKDHNNEQVDQLISLAKANNVPFTKVPLEKLNSITRKLHQGVVAYLSAVTYASLDNIITEKFAQGKDPLIIILDRITDVRNFGAICRTAECMGADAIVIPSKGSAQINGDAVKASAGALNHLPVCREESLKAAITNIKNNGLRIVACSEKAVNDVYACELKGPLAIIMGSEEDGISSEFIRIADEFAKIPLVGKVESLNVSVAAGMILYEVLRQRNT